jgi:hypothetical protein
MDWKKYCLLANSMQPPKGLLVQHDLRDTIRDLQEVENG